MGVVGILNYGFVGDCREFRGVIVGIVGVCDCQNLRCLSGGIYGERDEI